jgi:hypothetical protein
MIRHKFLSVFQRATIQAAPLSHLNGNGGVALLGEGNLLVFRSAEWGGSPPLAEAGLVSLKDICLLGSESALN